MVAPLALMGLSVAADLVGGLIGSAAPSPAELPGAGKPDRLRKAAQDFERLFLEQALDRWTEGGGEDGPLGGGGTGGGIYRSMLAREYAGSIVRSGGVGISEQVYRQMLQLQEGAARGG